MNLKEKDKQQKQKLSKQLEQEQDHRNGDHMWGYQWGSGREREGNARRLGEQGRGWDKGVKFGKTVIA